MTLPGRVLDTIRRHALLRRGDRVVVALSGGSDSVALLRILRQLDSEGELVVAGVAHLNHGLRDAAMGDEQFCRELSASLGVSFRSERIDVRELASQWKTSLEDAGRRARYAFFDRVAEELPADVVATGHTRDDQAETFLLRLVRGAGSRGLAGIYPKAGLPTEAPQARLPTEAQTARVPTEALKARRSGRWVIRPLIEIGRDDLRGYLAALRQLFCEDESNRDLTIPRNRVRHELLPWLAREFSPQVADVLAHEAELARYDEDRLCREAIDLLDSIVLSSSVRQRPDGHASADTVETVEVELSAHALGALHPALATRVARLSLQILAQDRFVGYEHVRRLLWLAGDDSERSVSLPGQHAVRRGATIVLSRGRLEPFSNSFRVSLSIPGEVILEREGWAISASDDVDVVGSGGWHPFGKGVGLPPHLSVAVTAESVTRPLVVRSRLPGDRFPPLGMGGRRKKLQDVLVDRKVPRERRDFLPLVVDSADRIVWVVGVAESEDFRVTEPSRGVIFLKARRLGGQG
jgi:tRNA(Ile)-lysidine synthase